MFSGFTTGMETSNPEIVYENAIASMIENHHQLKTATASILVRRNDIDKRLQAAMTEKRKAELNLEGAISLGNEELGIVLIKTADALTIEIEELKHELGVAEDDCAEAKEGLEELQVTIHELKSEKNRNVARLISAEARNKIKDQIDGISVNADVQALENVRAHIKNTMAKADLNREMGNGDLDRKLKKLTRESETISAKARFAELSKGVEKEVSEEKRVEELVQRSVARR
jgi:phage shock protein A